jgi:hypothetical protein
VQNKENVRVLLFGTRAMAFSVVRRRLEQRGCQCWFAISLEEGVALCEKLDFHLILCTGPVSQATSLAKRLTNTDCTAYCSYPVQDMSVWLPLLDHGRDCFGAPVLRPGQFLNELDGLITSIESDQVAAAAIVPISARRRDDRVSRLLGQSGN